MPQPEFLSWDIVVAIHRGALKRWGGIEGIRDRAVLESALGAAENVFCCGDGDRHQIAAAYAYHLAESQAFADGNKRTAIACASVFLIGNGCADRSDDEVLHDAMMAISAHRLDQRGFADVLRRQFPKL